LSNFVGFFYVGFWNGFSFEIKAAWNFLQEVYRWVASKLKEEYD